MAVLGAMGCTPQPVENPADCPYVMVPIDGGADAFSAIGEYRTGKECEQLCASPHRVCQLVDQGTVKCQESCL
ncbi:MAG: hypothetical protein HY898_17805 [Deltaproteobacteria bacterium]|nr:hypothetical protein [Deltaproteobacteria bacterium]